MVVNYLIGISTVLLLWISALVGTIFIMGPALPLLFVRPDLYRRYNDYVIQLWLIFPGAIFELLAGTRLKIYGDKPPADESCVIVMNHRCRLDWMFYWMVLLRYGSLSQEKILMRNDLKWIPGAGWAMQNVLYFFICRRWEQDKIYLDALLDYFIRIKYPIQFLMFPEGTNYCREGCEKSESYAKKNGLPNYKYCLHPRVRGFNFIVQKLRSGTIQAIHDVTIAYPKGLCYGELDLLAANFPKEILVRIDRYDIKDIPKEDDALDQWCIDRWKEKETLLTKIYEEGFIPNQNSEITDTDESAALSKVQLISIGILLFWAAFLTLATVLIYCYFWVRLYFVVTGALYFAIQVFVGGMDVLQLKVDHWNKERKNS